MRLRRLLGIGAIAAAVLFAAFCVYAWAVFLTAESRLERARVRFEREVGSLDLAKYVREPVPDDDNAAIPLRRALDALPRDDSGKVVWRRFEGIATCARAGVEQLDAAALRQVRIDIGAHAVVLHGAAAALDRPESDWGIRYDDVKRSFHPFPSDSRHLTDLLECDARLALHDGELDRALLRVESLFRLTASLHDEPEMVAHGLGNAWERRGFALLAEVLRRPGVDLDRLERAIPGDDPYVAWRRMFAADSARAYAWHRRMQNESGKASEKHWSTLFTAANLSRRVEFVTAADRSRSAAAAAAPTPWYSLPLLRIFEGMGIYRGSLDDALALKTQRSLARHAVALVRDARDRGVYPSSLVPASTASDDPVGDRPLAYLVRPDGSATLSAPGAAAVFGDTSRRDRYLLEWRLPRPAELRR